MHYQFALVSALAMGLFYIMDIVFAGLKVYTRPAHAMIVSAIVPLLTVPMFIFTFVDNYPFVAWNVHWHLVPLLPAGIACMAGVVLIWANWFYFLVMFPADTREAKLVGVLQNCRCMRG